MAVLTSSQQASLTFRRWLVKTLGAPLVHALLRVQAEGREHIPVSGPILMIGNHFHWIDGPLIGIYVPREIAYLGARAAFEHKGVGWLIRLYGTIPIERMGMNVDAIRLVMGLLSDGQLVGMFPEGRTGLDHLSEAWPGAAFLAMKSKARLLPVGVEGTFEAPTFWRRVRRAPVTVRFGEPFGPLSAPEGMNRKAALEWGTHEIMSRVAALLPERMRGSF